jgi:DNA primase
VRHEGASGFDARLRQAMPLSEFFFAELSTDVNMNTLDGKARLAERAKPMLAQIPDGAFGDLMQQRLTELTGVGARSSAPQTHVPVQRVQRGNTAATPKRSLVRSAITYLLQKPALGSQLEYPSPFVGLRQAGIPLLMELTELIRSRPGITTGSLLEHFSEREELAALQKLAASEFVGDESSLDSYFLNTIYQLDLQAVEQLSTDLAEKLRNEGPSALSGIERSQLASLLDDARNLRALIRQLASPA